MAHKPDDKYVGSWFPPEQIEQIARLAHARKLSRAELLRQLVSDAAKWLGDTSNGIPPTRKDEAPA